MTRDELDALEAMLAKATPGPYQAERAADENNSPIYDDDLGGYQWYVANSGTECTATCLAGPILEREAKAIAAALTAAPALLAAAREVEAKDAEIARLRSALQGLLSGSDPTMERIMWGEMPDEMTGSMTMKLGLYRAARAALGDPA